MIEYKCREVGCEEHITDAAHVDDCVTKLREHYRMVHPAKGFFLDNQIENIARFNQPLEEILLNQYGPNWNSAGNVGEVIYFISRYLLRDNNRDSYAPSTIATAEKFLEDHREEANAGNDGNGGAVPGAPLDGLVEQPDFIPVPPVWDGNQQFPPI